MTPPVRVVGVGSPSGDDAAGWAVVRLLRGRLAGRPGVECHLADGGHRLLEILDGRGSLIVVDAFVTGAPPGTIHRLEWPDPRAAVVSPGSTHALRPAEALQMAAALGVLPPRVVVFGIEAGSAELARGPSAAVEAAVPVLAGRIEQEPVLRR